MSTGRTLDIRLEPASDRFDADDERWIAQKGDLVATLARDVGGIRRSTGPAPGAKGVAESVILALGSAGAFRTALACWRAWLDRDQSRRIELRWTLDGREEAVVLDGEAMENVDFDRLMEALERLHGGGKWHTGDTADS